MATLQRLALRGTPKATKAAARYTPAGGAERCGMCRHYVPSSSCARIEGPVSAAGWCQLYLAAGDMASACRASRRA